ncbi:MAG: DMT family transporter, partial [Desulfovibrionaceae bacterium]|nr:DMT family transporter [Desulfovibrionaceae bacterium]
MQTKTLGFLAALGATVIWSGNFVVARGIAQDIPPVQLNFWRWAVALLCMLPLALPKLRADWPGLRRHPVYLSFMALTGVSAMNTLIYKAGQTTESLNMALLVPTAPIIIIVLSRIIYGDPITPRRLLGLALVLCGVLALISRGDWQALAHIRFTPGDFWALGGAACFGVYSLFIRRRTSDISAEGFTAATFALGLLYSLPALIWEMRVLPAPIWNGPVITGVLYSGVGCSFISFFLWTKSIAVIGPVRAGFVYYTLPLFAAVASVLVLGEHIT